MNEAKSCSRHSILRVPQSANDMLRMSATAMSSCRQRIEELLRSSEAVSNFLETPAPLVLPDGLAGLGLIDSAHDLQARFLGDFRILRELGRGGMGVVYEAEQVSLGRRVTLKILPFAALLDERQLERFTNEAAAVARLQHPHIVQVYTFGCVEGIHFYAMQLIEGSGVAGLIEQLKLLREQTAPRHRPSGCGGWWPPQRVRLTPSTYPKTLSPLPFSKGEGLR